MTHRAIVPEGMETVVETLQLSPAVASGDHVFVTGMTGSLPDGSMPKTVEAQFQSAFEKIEAVLLADGLDFGSVVEMTSYHLGLRAHFDVFGAVRRRFVKAPYPAWTAVEVAGLRREGALVEIRVIVHRP